MKTIPLSVPNLKGNELAYVTHAVETEWVSTVGPYVSDFEKHIANYVGCPMAVACQSGTSGLHIALLLCGVTPEDMVLVPTLTFIAAVNPVRYIGAEPVFMDCNDSLCMDPVKLEQFCQEECELLDDGLFCIKQRKYVKALVVVHVFGNMANMPQILAIAQRYHLKVVEDATEALGTHYEDGTMDNAYAGAMGDIGVYSFNGNKIITTGGGGMIVSRNEKILEHAKHLTTQAKSDPLCFEHDEVGYNYRLTNLQAALGLAQLEQLEEFIRIKTENYNRYSQLLTEIPHIHFLPFEANIRSNRWFYSLYLEDAFPVARDELIAAFTANQIQTRPIWGLIHEQIPYKAFTAYRIEKALQYKNRVVNLPCSTNLSCEEVDYVVKTLKKIGGVER